MRDFLKKCVDFRGRADVGEYCRWTLGTLIVAPVALRFLAVALYGAGVESNLPFQIWDALVDFILPIPASAVAFRRLHARGLSARYFFVPFGIVYAASFFPASDVGDDWLDAIFAGLALLIFVLCILPDDSEASPYSLAQSAAVAKVAKNGLERCSKCGAFAPPRNAYCRRCGAAFDVERDPVVRWGSFSAFRFCLAEKYADFRGRASRREFWSWTAAVVWIELFFAVCATVGAVDGLIGAPFWNVWLGANLALTPPTLAVLTRRLRDRDAPARFFFVWNRRRDLARRDRASRRERNETADFSRGRRIFAVRFGRRRMLARRRMRVAEQAEGEAARLSREDVGQARRNDVRCVDVTFCFKRT